MFNLEIEKDRRALVERLNADIAAFCKREFDEDPRKHLGASIIGHDCKAYLWNTFRWLKFEDHDARLLRLFNRGHEEEKRFLRWLRGVGFTVYDIDPATEKQYKIVGSRGHFGGSLDGLLWAPAAYAINEWLLAEFKTHNRSKYRELVKKGVQLAQPKHYKQMCSYGKAYGLRFAVYCAVNKDNDDLHFEVVSLDWRQADDLYAKADAIVFSPSRPPKIAQNATFKDCKYCDFAGLCHGNEVPTKNCRSCRLARPVDNAQWYCDLNKGVIPDDFIPHGCQAWARIA